MDNDQMNQGNVPPQQVQNQPMGGQVSLPNATAVLVLGILSIVFCWCYGIVGIVLGIIALVLSGKASSLYKDNPESYTIASFNNMKAGRICAIIGTILSALYIIFIIIYIFIIGDAFSAMPWEMMLNS